MSKNKLSIYAKEELPTWDEIYNEWYKGKEFIYDPEEERCQKEDLYWKIPHSMYLLLTVCNQLNKEIYENDMRNKVLNFIKYSILSVNMRGKFEPKEIRFVIYDTSLLKKPLDESNTSFKYLEEKYGIKSKKKDQPPLIYSIENPNGTKNPFIINDCERLYINNKMDFHKKAAIDIYVDFINGAIIKYSPFAEISENRDNYYKIINFMMKKYESYFENGVGWKDGDKILGIDTGKE